jgi:hypothetical protein
MKYNLDDPLEKTNLAPTKPEIVNQLNKTLDIYRETTVQLLNGHDMIEINKGFPKFWIDK